MSTHKKKVTGSKALSHVPSKKSSQMMSVASTNRMGKSTFGGTSRTVLSSSSRRNLQVGGASDKTVTTGIKAPVQVLDDNGQDVTPQPLLQLDPGTVRQKQSNILADSSGGTPTDLMSQASIYQTGTVSASTFGGGPFTRSVFSGSHSGATESISDDIVEPSAEIGYAWPEIKHRREEVKEELTETDLDKVVDITLTETDTIWLLDMTGVCVSAENDEASQIKERNTRYAELVKSMVGNDRYVERGMNTFNEAPKIKNIQTTKINYNDFGVTASNWDMYDSFQLLAEQEAKAKAAAEEAEEEGTFSQPGSPKEKKDEDKEEETAKTTTSVAREATQTSRSGIESRATNLSSMAGTDSVFASKESGVTSVPDQKAVSEQEALQSEDLKKSLVIMERVLNLNIFQPKQASYRGFPNITDVDKEVAEEATGKGAKAGVVSVVDMGPNLDRLWAFQCPLTKGRNVSCIVWNKVNPDLVAIGYGQYEFSNQKSGMVCCWSLKNPEFPERIYTTDAGVTSLDFSQTNASLLAVGLYDGTVGIYNVRTHNNEPILDSFESHGKHTGPVWQVRWIEKERGSGEERAEVLVSVSTDGRVTQWSIRKGFESNDLMRLKKVSTKASKGKEKKGEAFISRHAGGLAFDFSSKDSNIYLTGTEEGHIHKCSCSYNEQYLDSYFGHTGPVYSIQWSPFLPDVFLSCSGDWSIRLWDQERSKPVLTFLSSTKAVPDVCWSPRSSTVFACVNEGSIEVWDLSQSTLDPIIVNAPMSDCKLSTVSFARNSESLLVGDSEGQVTVYQLRCMPSSPASQEKALKKIMKSSLASQLQK